MESKAAQDPESRRMKAFGIVATIVGIMLFMGGFMFLAMALFLGHDFPILIYISPSVQCGMGLVSVLAGILAFRNVGFSKQLFFFALIVVFLNVGVLMIGLVLYILGQDPQT